MDVVTDARKAMEHWHRGQTSARFETDNRGPGWISSARVTMAACPMAATSSPAPLAGWTST